MEDELPEVVEWVYDTHPDSKDGATLATTIQVSGRNRSLRDLVDKRMVEPRITEERDEDARAQWNLYEVVFTDRDRSIPIPEATYKAIVGSHDILVADDAAAEAHMSRERREGKKGSIPGPWVEEQQRFARYDTSRILGLEDKGP